MVTILFPPSGIVSPCLDWRPVAGGNVHVAPARWDSERIDLRGAGRFDGAAGGITIDEVAGTGAVAANPLEGHMPGAQSKKGAE